VVLCVPVNLGRTQTDLGYRPACDPDTCQINPTVHAPLDPGTGRNHDFFSGSRSSYVMGTHDHG
jgi:ribonucleoside-diphosphate reductase beta chain